MNRLLLVLGLFCFTPVFAQNITISGTVTDVTDGSPLPGVNIFVKTPFSGTATNVDGRFTLTLSQRRVGTYLYFSSIGYKTDSIRLNRSELNVSIKLTPDVHALSDVVVFPDEDALRRLLREAFERIPQNYSIQPVRYEVFYRETNRDSTGMIVAVAEAILDIFKNSYTQPNDHGQVRVVKSRKNVLPQYNELVPMGGFIGGAHSFVRGNYVFTRRNVIHPNHFDRFNFQLAGMTRFDGRDVYIIEFQSRTSSFNGRLYIDVESLAYVRISWNNPSVVRELRFTRENRRGELNYIYFQGNWHLNHILYSDVKRFGSRPALHQSTEHLVLSINTDNVAPIPHEEQLAFREPFLEFAQQYDPDFWTGYNILQHDEVSQHSFSAHLQDISLAMATASGRSRMERRQQFFHHFSRIYAGININYRAISTIAGNYIFDYQGIVFEKNIPEQQIFFEFGSMMGYSLTRRTSVYYASNSRLAFNSDLFMTNHIIGTEYRRNIKSRGRPLFVGANLNLGWSRHYVDWGNMQNSYGSFNIGRKTFDSDRINIRSGVNRFSVLPGISLSTRASRLFEITLDAKYDFAFSTREFVRIRERDGFFLTRRSATLSGDYLQIADTDGVTRNDFLNIAPFQVSLMFVLR